jgi:hypothetical protein
MRPYTEPKEDFISALFGKPFEALTCRQVCEKLEAMNISDRVEFKVLLEKREVP